MQRRGRNPGRGGCGEGRTPAGRTPGAGGAGRDPLTRQNPSRYLPISPEHNAPAPCQPRPPGSSQPRRPSGSAASAALPNRKGNAPDAPLPPPRPPPNRDAPRAWPRPSLRPRPLTLEATPPSPRAGSGCCDCELVQLRWPKGRPGRQWGSSLRALHKFMGCISQGREKGETA